MGVRVNLDTIILFVSDVACLKAFYLTAFDMEVLEDGGAEWVLLKTDGASIGLHRVGEDYSNKKNNTGSNSNVKMVFEITTDIDQLRNELNSCGALMREVKTFAGYEYWLCDGEDPEGNVFQLKQKK